MHGKCGGYTLGGGGDINYMSPEQTVLPDGLIADDQITSLVLADLQNLLVVTYGHLCAVSLHELQCLLSVEARLHHSLTDN